MNDIHLQINSLAQLFDSLDPAPFREKALDRDADAYLLESAREYPRRAPLRIVVHGPASLEPSLPDIATAVRAHFSLSRSGSRGWSASGAASRGGPSPWGWRSSARPSSGRGRCRTAGGGRRSSPRASSSWAGSASGGRRRRCCSSGSRRARCARSSGASRRSRSSSSPTPPRRRAGGLSAARLYGVGGAAPSRERRRIARFARSATPESGSAMSGCSRGTASLSPSAASSSATAPRTPASGSFRYG